MKQGSREERRMTDNDDEDDDDDDDDNAMLCATKAKAKVRNDKLETNADGNRDTTRYDEFVHTQAQTTCTHKQTNSHTQTHRKQRDGGHNKNQRNKLNNMKKKHCTARTPKTSWK